jgi:hypothetical protein
MSVIQKLLSLGTPFAFTGKNFQFSPKSASSNGAMPPSPPVTSTVITVTGRHDSSQSEASSQSRRTSEASPKHEETFDPKSVAANTHIIRVSGPVSGVEDTPAASAGGRERSASEVDRQLPAVGSTSAAALSTSPSPPSPPEPPSSSLAAQSSSKFAQTTV